MDEQSVKRILEGQEQLMRELFPMCFPENMPPHTRSHQRPNIKLATVDGVEVSRDRD